MMITSGPLTKLGVAVGAIVGVSVGLGVGVFVSGGVGDGVAVGCNVGNCVAVEVAVGCSITVGVSEGTGERVRVGEGVYVGNKPIARIDISAIATAKHPQQQRVIARGITGKASLLPAMVGLIRTESNLRNTGFLALLLKKTAAKSSFLSSSRGEKMPKIHLPTFR